MAMGRSPTRLTNRREFCAGAATLAFAASMTRGARLWAQPGVDPFNAIRPDVAAIDHDRILAAATRALANPVPPLPSYLANDSPGSPQDYFSEVLLEDAASTGGPAALKPFTAHRDAVLQLGLAVGALAAAQKITGEQRYADSAAAMLRTWFLAPATRMSPALDYAQVPLGTPRPTVAAAQAPSARPTLGEELAAADSPRTRPPSPNANPQPQHTTSPGATRQGSYTGVIETLPFVEVVRAIPFVAAAGALSPQEVAGLRAWFSSYLTWLTQEQDTGPRLAALARDSKDHNATSWLLQVAAYRLFTAPDTSEPAAEDRSFTELRHRFRSVTLRSQVSAEGNFPHEVSTANPYRNSLFNLDMLACLCLLLSTRFENVWDFQLQDGPGMRGAIAFHYPFMVYPARWPYRADAQLFSELPSRRPSLLLSARAYQRPEYAALWKSLAPDPPSPEILRTIPIHQPLLWVTQPPRLET